MSEQSRPSVNEVTNIFLSSSMEGIAIDSNEIAISWMNRLSKLTQFYDQLGSNIGWQAVLSR